MRLHSGNFAQCNKIIAEFSKWKISIGDGTVPGINRTYDNEEVRFEILGQFIVHQKDNHVQDIFDITYPNFLENISDHDYLRSRVVLTPTNVWVDDINYFVIDKIPGETYTYLSQDSFVDNEGEDNDFDSSFHVEYLNSINMPCLPKHELKLKIGDNVMLMRNLNQILGLCNRTRKIVTGH